MDLNIDINGDASGAKSAFDEAGGGATQLGEDVGKSVVKWQALLNVATEAAKVVVKFGIDSVKAYADSERILKQLERAAGNYAGKLDEQSKAMSKLYAVDDDVIKQSQTLLVQWGGVGAATADVEKAALNLAAAFGGDLNSATQDLIRNVESGGTGLAKMGIHFKSTGDKGHDLAAAVAAINKKLGGSAEANANSLTGQLAAAGIAFDDIKKSIGGSIAAFITQHGLVKDLTEALHGMQTAMGVGDVAEQNAKNEAYLQLQEHLLANLQQRAALLKGVAEMEARGEASPKSKAMIAHLDENIVKLKEIIRLENAAHAGGGDSSVVPAVTDPTNKGLKDAASTKPGRTDEERLQDAKKYYQGIEELAATAAAQEQADYADELALSGKRVAGDIKESDERTKIRRDMLLGIEKDNAEHAEKMAKIQKTQEDKATTDTLARSKQKADDAARVGDAIGGAFVNALTDQLSKLAAGAEFDVAIFVGDILASVISIAGTVIGTAYGQPALGAAVGNLAAMGVRAGASAISADAKKNKMTKKYHSGGWVGDEAELPRYHSGAWIGDDERHAILQTDERVLSRQETRAMGGRTAVDSMARGGGGSGMSVTVIAMDAKNAAEGFMGEIGRGLKNALRSGHGDVPRLLGMSPR